MRDIKKIDIDLINIIGSFLQNVAKKAYGFNREMKYGRWVGSYFLSKLCSRCGSQESHDFSRGECQLVLVLHIIPKQLWRLKMNNEEGKIVDIKKYGKMRKEKNKKKIEEDFSKIPDKKQKPFTYNLWKERGMLDMTPEERVLMNALADISAFQSWMFGNYDWWDLDDMKKFVKDIVPKILREHQRNKKTKKN